MSIYLNAILVTLSLSEPFVCIRTYDEKHGRSQRFFINKSTLLNQLGDDAEGNSTEADILNFCTIARIGTSIRFNMFWLHGSYNDDICGYRQTFVVPVDKVSRVLAGEKVKHLSHIPACQPKADVFFTQTAHRAIAALDKLKRHALRKFLRDNFCYGRDEHLVIQQDEWVNGFYFFSTTSRYEGGIVPHETTVMGKDGKQHVKAFYGLHT